MLKRHGMLYSVRNMTVGCANAYNIFCMHKLICIKYFDVLIHWFCILIHVNAIV